MNDSAAGSTRHGLSIARVLDIVVLGDYEDKLTPALRQKLPTNQFRVYGYTDTERHEEALLERLGEAHVVVVIRERTPLPGTLLQRLPKLALIVTTGTNNSVIGRDASIPIAYTRSHVSAAAEHTWALLLALARRLPEEAQRLEDGLWQRNLGTGLQGRTLGILGLGRVGERVAAVGRAFDMRIAAWSPHMTAAKAESHGAQAMELQELFSESDIVSLHLRLSDQTRGLIDAGLLSVAKPGMLLVNTARSGLINEADVIAALETGHLGGLAQDVFDNEPLPPESRIMGAPRTLLTPHLGYATDTNFELFATDVAENIQGFLRGTLERKLDG